MLLLSVLFSLCLVIMRFLLTWQLSYFFYFWNTLLAIVPLCFSRGLRRYSRLTTGSAMMMAGWLVFFPNAAYMITDIFHYEFRPPVPMWFDLLVVITAAWNGLLLGIVSLMQVEHFLAGLYSRHTVTAFIFFSAILCGYGVYLGRVYRFNSWDVVTAPSGLASIVWGHLLRPFDHIHTWGFTFLFAIMFSIVYFTLKQLRTTGNG